MIEEKIAIISDVHGNTWALKEVLKDIKSKGIETIINLGDNLNGPLDPKGTFDLLIDNNVLSICGNGDRLILESLGSVSQSKTFEYIKSQINPDVIEWLKALPFELIINGIYCCHASPHSDTSYLLEDLKANHVSVRDFNEIDDSLKNIEQNVIVCGHSHIARVIMTESQKIVINPGSVGLPAYGDELPIPHNMESFNPFAKYSTITKCDEHISVEHFNIPYDFETAAKMAEKNERNDWAKWIRTGIV